MRYINDAKHDMSYRERAYRDEMHKQIDHENMIQRLRHKRHVFRDWNPRAYAKAIRDRLPREKWNLAIRFAAHDLDDSEKRELIALVEM